MGFSDNHEVAGKSSPQKKVGPKKSDWRRRGIDFHEERSDFCATCATTRERVLMSLKRSPKPGTDNLLFQSINSR
jgi:hypothetical protein